MSYQRDCFMLVVVMLSGCVLDPKGSGPGEPDAASPTDGGTSEPGGDPPDTSTGIPDVEYTPDVSQPDGTIEPPCDDGASRCTDDALQACVGDSWEDTENCALGCHETEVRCLRFVPSNVTSEVAQLMETATAEVVVDSSITLDTDDEDGAARLLGEAVSASVVSQDNGPDLCVLVMASLEIRPGATLRAVGSRALVLLASGEVSIGGTLNVGAHGAVPGAGGGAPGEPADGAPDACAGGDGEGESHNDSGGGGGGHGGSGGAGGRAGSGGDVAAPGAAGQADGNQDLMTLRGGCGGGDGNGSSGDDGFGGGGGGAVQISSATAVRVTAVGGVAAGGGGGGGGNQSRAGGGGGAGGGVLMEAPVVEIADNALVAANGGGGGGGGTNIEQGGDGPDGALSFVAAPGGAAGAGGRASAGGAGGDYRTDNGNPALAATYNSGGGGGGVGRIRINTRPGGFSGDLRLSPQGAPVATQGATQGE